MRIRQFAALGLTLAAVTTACGNQPSGGTGAGRAIDHPSGPDQLVLRVETGGGFLPPEYALRAVPNFSLMGDGRVIVGGPQIEIYPAPALPNLLETLLTEAGVQAILREAERAGLLGPDRSYDIATIADAGTTTFTVVADGRRHVVSAYALGYGEDGPGTDPEELAARQALLDFQAALFDLRRWLPEGAAGEERPYRPEALRLFVRPYEDVSDDGLRQASKDWPLDPALQDFGEPTTWLPDTRCGVVEGADAETLLRMLAGSNELTPWVSEDERFLLVVRPLLPDESGCPEAGSSR